MIRPEDEPVFRNASIPFILFRRPVARCPRPTATAATAIRVVQRIVDESRVTSAFDVLVGQRSLLSLPDRSAPTEAVTVSADEGTIADLVLDDRLSSQRQPFTGYDALASPMIVT